MGLDGTHKIPKDALRESEGLLKQAQRVRGVAWKERRECQTPGRNRLIIGSCPVEKGRKMETKRVDKSVLQISALCYTGTSLAVVILFVVLSQIVGGYPTAAVIGGAIWSFILSMIVTMPLYTSHFKKGRMGHHRAINDPGDSGVEDVQKSGWRV